MSGLALVTWRLPQTRLSRLERAREAIDGSRGPPGVFTFTTCQRALAATVAEDPHQATERLAETFGVAGGDRRTGFDAFRHLALVAASLDALVPGEDQVPAQFRQALDEQADRLTDELRERLERVRALSRKARNAGGLAGHESRSLVDLAEPLVPQGALAVVGTGMIAHEAVDTLDVNGPVHVASRDPDRARELAGDAQRAWIRRRLLDDPPPLASLVLATRTGEDHVLSADEARRIAEERPGDEPLVIVDLGVPRNAEPAVSRLGPVQLYTVEDLARIAREREDDEQIRRARDALADGVARQRRRWRIRSREERVVALREELAEELEALADQWTGSADEVDEWVQRAHGRLAHASQRHLEAALRGEEPP